jgi:hypothetical protein
LLITHRINSTVCLASPGSFDILLHGFFSNHLFMGHVFPVFKHFGLRATY